MLIEVLAVVEAQGWFDTGLPFEKTIYLSQGSAQCVLLSRGGLPDIFVKFTELMSLAGEAARGRLAAERFPAHAPQFVGYARQVGLEILVTRAVDFRPMTGATMSEGRDGIAVCTGLEQFFRRMRESEAGREPGGHAWFEDFCAYFDAHGLRPGVAPGLQRLREALKTLPALSQHGDLVLNNLGLRPRRQLVIFDWEDYGAVKLPGLDLFTLENSVRQDRARAALDIGRLCEALGLGRECYESLRLGYALVFRYLKRNYNAEVRARLDQVIDGLVEGSARL